MIVVALGTQKHSFERVINYIEQIISEALPEEEIYIQAGETEVSAALQKKSNLYVEKYFPNFDQLIEQTDLVITHGGVGTIASALLKGKIVFSIPRAEKLNEHIDDHQFELVEELDKNGYIKMILDYQQFRELISEWERDPSNFWENRKTFKSNNKEFNRKLYLEIDKMLN